MQKQIDALEQKTALQGRDIKNLTNLHQETISEMKSLVGMLSKYITKAEVIINDNTHMRDDISELKRNQSADSKVVRDMQVSQAGNEDVIILVKKLPLYLITGSVTLIIFVITVATTFAYRYMQTGSILG